MQKAQSSVDKIAVFSFQAVQFFNSFVELVSHFLHVMLFQRSWCLRNVRWMAQWGCQDQTFDQRVVTLQEFAQGLRLLFFEVNSWSFESFSLFLYPCPSAFSDEKGDRKSVQDGSDDFLPWSFGVETFLDESGQWLVKVIIEIIGSEIGALK